MHNRTFAALFALWVLIASCSTIASAASDPAIPVVPGWRCVSDTLVYTPENLYNLIDGAADAFLAYGFVDLRQGAYTSAEGIEIRAEFYRHNSPTNAFGIYALERKPDYHFVTLGAQGYLEENILNFLTGRYYIKLSTRSEGDTARRSLLSLARALSVSLGERNQLPAILEAFPAADKVVNGESYMPENFLGYSALSSAFIAQYASSVPYAMFLIPCADSVAAQTMLSKYCGAIHQPVPKPNASAVIDDPNNGRIGIFQQGRFLGGILNLQNDNEVNKQIRRLEGALTTANLSRLQK